MAFSIESIRNLNKIHLLAMNIEQKQQRVLSTEAWGPGDKGIPWRVSLYGGASIGIGGNIEYDNMFGNIVKSITSNAVIRTAMTVANVNGIAPDVDLPRKYLYSGVNNLSFHARGMLVLEDDIVQDFFVPIEKLSYLAFPDRGRPLTLGEDIKKISDSLSAWLKKTKGVEYSFTNMVGGAFNSVKSMLGQKDADTTDSAGYDALMEGIRGIIGVGYTMTVPPTFHPDEAGSGLDFRYGGILISDVFIKSLKFEIPKLYYQGGYPAVINVDMDLETMRPLTATAITKMMMTQTQAWAEDNSMPAGTGGKDTGA